LELVHKLRKTKPDFSTYDSAQACNEELEKLILRYPDCEPIDSENEHDEKWGMCELEENMKKYKFYEDKMNMSYTQILE